MKVDKICILCPYSFPEGMAPSTRIIAYGKGLVQNSVETEVVCFFPKRKEDQNPNEGEINGVKWSYIQQKKYGVSRAYNMLVERPKVIWKTLKYIKQSNKVKRINFVLLSFDSPVLLLIMTILLRLAGFKVGFIGDEYPQAIRELKNRISRKDTLLFKISHKFMSFRILMTQKLIDYYNSNICERPSYLFGSILDEGRFGNVTLRSNVDSYLCYMGNMQLTKDNVDNIIEAFSLICDKYPELHLYLYGTPSNEDKKIIKELIEKKQLTSRILLKGRADYNDVPSILANARILVTSQPNTMRAEGGFPTKMGEYMMSHVPMIVTDVGEISNYVQDGVTTYMVPPCDPKSYAKKIEYVLNHKRESELVAECAYNYAIKHFSSTEVAKGLVNFMSTI